MVTFAGYELPVQYSEGIKAEHEYTRAHAGLFDISHMGQIRIRGEDTVSRLETLVPGDITGLNVFRQRYSVLTNDTGGVIDDLMITRMPDHFFLVVNAARRHRDYTWLRDALPPECAVEDLPDRGLLAVQGPDSARVLAELDRGIADLPFLGGGEFRLGGVQCIVHRCGYTGEDGFEISMEGREAENLAATLLGNPLLKPAGLGARDSLRLEAGLCLYGHELDETITPVEADLAWVIARKYRTGEIPAGFPGADRILEQLRNGPPRIRAGFRPEGGIPVREGTIISTGDGINAGIITSGGYGPTAGGPVAMGYSNTTLAENQSRYRVEIRGQHHTIERVKLPFVRHRYHKPSG